MSLFLFNCIFIDHQIYTHNTAHINDFVIGHDKLPFLANFKKSSERLCLFQNFLHIRITKGNYMKKRLRPQQFIFSHFWH